MRDACSLHSSIVKDNLNALSEQLTDMVIPSSIAGPVVGAFISGLIGVGTVEYRNWRQGKAELKGWYDGAIRLAERLERAHIDKQYGGNHGRYVRATCAGVHSKLASHVSEAPESIEEESLKAAEELIADCQRIVAVDERTAGSKPDRVMEPMEEALESADTLITEAKVAKRRV